MKMYTKSHHIKEQRRGSPLLMRAAILQEDRIIIDHVMIHAPECLVSGTVSIRTPTTPPSNIRTPIASKSLMRLAFVWAGVRPHTSVFVTDIRAAPNLPAVF
jgi:hypothetical protein